MKNIVKNAKNFFFNKGKVGVFYLMLSFGILVSCEGVLEDTNPFSPSTTVIRVVPNKVSVTQGGEQTFTTIEAIAPFSWTSSKLNIGTIVFDTGVFTAGTISGTTTITLIDAIGDTATAVVTVTGLPLTFDIAGATQIAAGAADVITVTINGSGAGFTTSITNDTAGTLYGLKPTTVNTATTITITSPATLPTAVEGDQNFTITVTDTGNGNTGTIAYALTAAAAV
jgi:hypothetical protein